MRKKIVEQWNRTDRSAKAEVMPAGISAFDRLVITYDAHSAGRVLARTTESSS